MIVIIIIIILVILLFSIPVREPEVCPVVQWLVCVVYFWSSGSSTNENKRNQALCHVGLEEEELEYLLGGTSLLLCFLGSVMRRASERLVLVLIRVFIIIWPSSPESPH